jgi:hypothetical protein
MAKEVIVEAVGITNLQTGDDPGNDLEIYGHLGAWRVLGPGSAVEHRLMDRMNPDSAQSITQGSTLHIGMKTPAMTIGNNEQLWVGGHLKEQDIDPNDSLGDRHLKLLHDEIRSERRTVHFFESAQMVEAIFEITVLRVF